MSSSGISFGGLASGLDTQAIIGALLAVEQRPISQLEQKVSSYKSSKSKFGNLEDLLDTLSDKSNALRKTANFVEYAASLDVEDYMTADASTSATPGTYRIQVDQLATNQVSTSGGFADKTTNLGNGTLLVTVDGVVTPVTIDSATSGTTNLEDIASAINNENLGIRAQVVDTGNPTDPFQLVLTGEETGSVGAFSIALDGPADPGLTSLVGGLTTPVTADDALVTVGGIQYTRSTNTIADVISGVTLNLKKEGSQPTPETTTLTIAPDNEATATKITEFVDAYNAVVDFVKNENVLNDEGEASSALFGDVTLRQIRSSMRGIVGDSVDTGNTAYALLSQIGIESDRDGKLTFTQSEFDEALAADPDAVRDLFTDATGGIAQRVYDQIDIYTDTVDGLIKTRKDGFDSLIKQTESRIEQAERRLEAYELQLTNKFASLESLLSTLQNQGSALNFPS